MNIEHILAPITILGGYPQLPHWGWLAAAFLVWGVGGLVWWLTSWSRWQRLLSQTQPDEWNALCSWHRQMLQLRIMAIATSLISWVGLASMMIGYPDLAIVICYPLAAVYLLLLGIVLSARVRQVNLLYPITTLAPQTQQQFLNAWKQIAVIQLIALALGLWSYWVEEWMQLFF